MNILITGSSSGIGKQLALDYLELGHTVYCCGRNRDALEAITSNYPAALALVFDVQNLDDCRAKLANLPKLDLVILNAGTCEYIDARQFDAASFKRVVDINLIGTANCLEPVIPRIRVGGTLALMGSSSSYLPLPRAEAYGASKAATEYLAKTLAISLKSAGIHVSYIAPGFVETALTDRNDFPMPMRVDVNYASKSIRQGIQKRQREIHFPKKFTGILKAIAWLPAGLQQRLIARAVVR